MAWIDGIDEGDATGSLADLYARMQDPLTGKVANILSIHSLDEGALEGHHKLYRAVMHPTKGLSRAEREMIAVAVSQTNDCFY